VRVVVRPVHDATTTGLNILCSGFHISGLDADDHLARDCTE
jgi:hypothetical protein